MSPELRRYLDLEQAMLALDAHGNPEADHVRDIMDGAWHDLTAEDRAWLNAREVPPLGNELRLAVGKALFVEPRKAVQIAPPKWEFDSWRGAA
jgi:hypothetical protein